MNKKLIFGVGVALVVGVGVFIKFGRPQTTEPKMVQKEINVGQDVCREFPKEWVQSVLNKTVVKIEESGTRGTYVCQYYVNNNNFVTLRLNNLNFEDQKKGQQALGRTIITNDRIPINHFVAMQSDRVINDIVLEINPNVFLAVDRSTTTAANEAEIMDFAVKVAERIQRGENQGTTVAANIVPLPQEKDMVNNFFQVIGEGRASDAVMMMTGNITNDESTKQGFGVMFNAMNSVKVKKIEESMKENWTKAQHQYKVTLDVVMDPSSADGPIPYYGFERGENVRFINLVKEGDLWKIAGLATGP